MNSHQCEGLGPGFLTLRNMHVHLVTIEVGVVGRTDRGMESKGPIWKNLHIVGHDRHSVKRRLSVEYYDVTVRDVSFHDETGGQCIGHSLSLGYVV